MKVNTIKHKDEFKPSTTCITFETEDEYNLFRKMVGHSLTIPEMLCPYKSDDAKKLSTMMVNIFQTMPKLT